MSKGFRFQGTVLIANQEFTAAITKINKDNLLNLYWKNTMGISMKEVLKSLASQMGIESVEAIPFDFVINRIGIAFNASQKAFLFHTSVANKQKEQLAVLDVFAGEGQGTGVIVQLTTPIYFNSIPILGKLLLQEDGIKGFILSVRKQKDKDMEWGLKLQYSFQKKEELLVLGNLYDSDVIYKAVNPLQGNTEGKIHSDLAVMEKKQQNTSLENRDVADDLGIKWFTLNKGIGPFTIRRIGGAAKQEGDEFKVFLYVDAKMSFSVVDIELMGLSVGIPISALTNFNLKSLKELEFAMSGLGISFQKGPLSISGSFLRTKGIRERYDGAVMIKFMEFQFVGIGSYTTTEDGEASLFLYLMVGAPIGGVGAFFVTGLAAGFGVNRGIRTPDVKDVKSFPLVSMVMEDRKPLDINQAMAEMKNCIYESKGEYFVAAGIRFTTYELLHSFALAIVTFGQEFQVQLLGLSTISLPSKASSPFLYAELAIKAVIAPSKGILSFEATLTSASYLFCKDCRLTGGFAFYLWFSGEHKGDFVITLGGYHPKFQKPSHYPSVDRVGISWKIGENLSLQGQGYFAVTSTAIMAGGAISFLFEMGNLKAWFSANADFLISWAPFYYDIDVGVSVGVSYTLKILFARIRLKVELGARLHLFGPEFAGSVYISWHIISFTIQFGNKSPKPVPLSYNEFKDKFLSDPLKLQVTDGLQGEYKNGDKAISLVNIKKAAFRFESRLPLTTIILGSKSGESTPKELSLPSTSIGVLPMGEEKRLYTVNTILLYRKKKEENGTEYYEEIREISKLMEAEITKENLPYALWGTKECSPLEVKLVKDVVTGLKLRAKVLDDGETKIRFTPFYDLKELLKNDELDLAKQCAPCFKNYFIEDDFRLNLSQIMKKMKNRRTEENNIRLIEENKKKTIRYLRELQMDIWDSGELMDKELYLEPENHFMVQPVKRSVYK
ncbi:MAG: hypothetical protein NC412_04225 [Roseburia sp.]|nr:hypothetical protein [Roseburia sp.]MCM1278110.1 hypothetical protein [Robinsoniella sp.]